MNLCHPDAIAADRIYPLALFRGMSGLSRRGMDKAREAGLRVRTFSGRSWVIGRDWYEFLDTSPLVTSDAAST
jgi:hypothetical protein